MLIDIAVFGFLLILSVVLYAAQRAAYRNGVTDGYGYAKEPNCPGYHEAGRYLRQHMAHRWPELLDRDEVEPPWRRDDD